MHTGQTWNDFKGYPVPWAVNVQPKTHMRAELLFLQENYKIHSDELDGTRIRPSHYKNTIPGFPISS